MFGRKVHALHNFQGTTDIKEHRVKPHGPTVSKRARKMLGYRDRADQALVERDNQQQGIDGMPQWGLGRSCADQFFVKGNSL